MMQEKTKNKKIIIIKIKNKYKPKHELHDHVRQYKK